MSSVSGQMGNAGQANYSAFQGRADRADEGARPRGCLARDHRQRRRPRFVVTELTDGLPESVKDAIKAATPLGRFASVDEIAATVAFLASDEAGYITGRCWPSTAAS